MEEIGKKCRILPVQYARSALSESMIFENGAADRVRPILFCVYLIQTQDRKILVDAGCETMPGFDMKDFIGPVKALNKLGVCPEDITDLVLTHAHHDHIECTRYFSNATIYIQKDEYEAGKDFISQTASVILFDEEYMVYKNTEVVILVRKIGGHTKGSSIVEVREKKSVFVIAGDECYARECLEKRIPTGSSINPEKSRWFVEEYSRQEYTVLLCHDQ